MKISYKQLKKYIANLPEPEQLADLLTNCGLEVENLEYYSSIPGGLKGFVTGEVISKEKHPNADKLSICKVNTGEDTIFNVVCGAPNVEKGQKIIFAPVGTQFYKGNETFVLKKAKIRGIVSEGMICAEDEIGLGTLHEGIIVLPDNVKVGLPASVYFDIYEDVIFEIGLTPNRVDAASYIGVARDIAAVMTLNSYCQNQKNFVCAKVDFPDISEFHIHNTNLNIEVEIQNENCIRYSGVTVSNIKVEESPQWLKNVLKSTGIRPVNNIVDITNFVLFETGQPLHAFDASKIKGNKIIVKTLPDKTPFITLDGVKRELSGDDLMICNTEEPMCIAGVFGGIESGITSATTAVFIESACFNPSSIRRTSKYHSLKTDASFRYERGSDPEITIYALKRAALLIGEIAGGTVSSEIKDVYPLPVQHARVYLSFERLNTITGIAIDKNIVKLILETLQIKIVNEENDGLLLDIPPFKNDVTREADVIEEILRIYGYNKIPLTGRINASLGHNIENIFEASKKTISTYLTANGFYEIICNSLTSQDYYEKNKIFSVLNSVKIINPISKDLNVLRQTLLYGGLEIIAYNRNRKIQDMKLFEFGNVYKLSDNYNKNADVTHNYLQQEMLALFMTGKQYPENWYMPDLKIDIYYIKSYVYNILKKIGVKPESLVNKNSNPELFSEGLVLLLNENIIVEFGQLNPVILKKTDIKEEVFYASFNWNKILELLSFNNNIVAVRDLPKFPEVKRDMALLIDKNVKYSEIEEIAYKTAKPLLKKVSLFDVYEGDNIEAGKKSYAIRFIIESEDKTLTDEIIDNIMNKLKISFEKNLNAKIR